MIHNIASEMPMWRFTDSDIGGDGLGEIFTGDRTHPVLGVGLERITGIDLVS